MPRWAVLRAKGEAEAYRHTVHREFEGTETEAMAELFRLLDTFEEHRRRRRVYRISERCYLVRVEGRLFTSEARFTLAELVVDTEDVELPDGAGELAGGGG
ncbi:hypothetical protein AB0D49_03510 [Streptomyces sp. NPDC048290]|uniref:hypothetical protein n=1 Tax=Streptomyces sp. NPDC048290 TaxID=3155811 RepID=UPI003437A9C9